MASSITPTPLTRAAWTDCGACTSGSTAHPGGATSRASGGAAMMSTTRLRRMWSKISRRTSSGGVSSHAFLGVSALLFAVSAAVTIVWCASMSAMGEMTMPGGWTMSTAWMRMPGQTWTGAAASFLGMWVVMMVAMMLPSLIPNLWRYRQAIGRTGETHLGRLTALVGVGYLFVWTRVEGDLRAMAVVAAAITVERLVPAGE